MTEPLTVDGVTITPVGGGYYELKHTSLAEPEKVRGQEKATDRAKEIAAEAENGSIPPQGTIPQAVPALGGLEPAPETAPETVNGKQATDDPRDTELADMKAMMARQQELIEQLLNRPVASVEPQAEPVEPVHQGIPRSFTGQVDAKTRAAAKAKGIEYVTIVLEENPDIPPTGLFIGHNGRGYMISPGEPVDVPDFLLGVLDHAVMAAPVVDSKSQKILGYRDRMRYPYRRV